MTRYFNSAVSAFLALLLCACSNTNPIGYSVQNQASTQSGSSYIIELNSPEGEKRLYQSQAHTDFLPLSIHFETQQNLAYCGVASMTMVLNASQIPAPTAPEYKPYPMFTQNNLFNEKTEQIISINNIKRQGMTLGQFGQLLAAYGLKTKAIYASDITVDQFRTLAVKNLAQHNNFIVVNYLRKAIGQESGGHISPLAAYHKQSDSFLILVVSRYKYPPVWVSAELLWQAMNTIDKASGKTRGFVLIDLEDSEVNKKKE